MINKFKFVLLFLVLITASGCVLNETVWPDQVAVRTDGGRLYSDCLTPGLYNFWYPFDGIQRVSVGALTFDVSDPSVATKDTQIVGVSVTIQAKRKADCESVHGILTNWPLLKSDEKLQETISATTNEAIKVGVREMTLAQLLDDRNGLSNAVTKALTDDANKYYVEIINVSIKDIALDPEYEAKLKLQAQITVDTEIAKRKQEQIIAEAESERKRQEELAKTYAAQLAAEEAKTNVEVEIASREGEKIQAEYEVYENNPAAYELKRLELLRQILGDKATVYFVENVEELMLLLGGTDKEQVIPVQP